jgi:hypothetical protein
MEAKVYDSNTFSSVAFRVATGNVLLPPPKKKSSFPSPDKYKFDSSKYRPPLLYNLSISRLDNVEESVLEGAEEEDIVNPNSIQEDVVCTKFIFSVARCPAVQLRRLFRFQVSLSAGKQGST